LTIRLHLIRLNILKNVSPGARHVPMKPLRGALIVKERRGMLARSVNRTDRKTAAQRSRDLFATLAGAPDRGAEPTLTVSRIRSRRGEPVQQSGTASALEANEPMSASRLSVVPSAPAPAAESEPETTAARIRRLQAEAQALAREEVAALERRIAELAGAARLVAEGGDAYPIGAREIARRLAEDLPRQAGVLEALLRKL
jgi:hypothetical protein